MVRKKSLIAKATPKGESLMSTVDIPIAPGPLMPEIPTANLLNLEDKIQAAIKQANADFSAELSKADPATYADLLTKFDENSNLVKIARRITILVGGMRYFTSRTLGANIYMNPEEAGAALSAKKRLLKHELEIVEKRLAAVEKREEYLDTDPASAT